MERLLQAASRFVVWAGLANLTSLLLSWAVLVSLVLGLKASIVGLDVWPLLLICSGGLLLGWLLAASRLHALKASLMFMASGLLGSTLWIARLGKPLVNLVLAGGYWLLQVLLLERWDPEAFAALDTTALWNAWSAFSQASQTVASRISGWLLALLTGHPVYDPLVVQFVLALAVWSLSGWAAWWTHRRGQPLIGALPAGALLATFLAYSGVSIYLLIIWIGCVVTLQALSGYAKWKRDWQARHVDMAEIELEWAFAVVGIAIFSMMGAAIAPSISIEKISDRIQRLFTPNTGSSNSINQAFGLRPRSRTAPTPLELARSTRLPNEHLLGSGPELSEKVVMWVSLSDLQSPPGSANAPPPAQAPRSYYWRSLTYDQYNGRGWSTLTSQTETIPAGQSIAEQLAKNNLQEVVQQHLHIVGAGDGLLYITGELLAASQDYKVAWRTPGDIFGVEVAVRDYWANSRLPQASPQQLRSAGNDYPGWVQKTYLALPRDLPPRVRNLAFDLSATQPTPYDQAIAIQRYLRGIPYSLDLLIPPGNRDLVDYFLFDLKKGFCDYYASAMVVLARAAGLPARLVVGYASGNYQPETMRFVVTEADAHAWAEVYFPGYGWVEFEPTANRPELTSPDEADTQSMQTRPDIPFPSPKLTFAGNPWLLLWWAVITLTALPALFLLWVMADSWRLRLLPPRTVIMSLYRRLYAQSEKLLGHPSPSHTPHEFMTSLSQRLKGLLPAGANASIWRPIEANLRALVELYARAIYSPHAPAEVEKSNAINIWRTLQPYLWQVQVKRIFKLIRGK